jgi:hypothetical protein
MAVTAVGLAGYAGVGALVALIQHGVALLAGTDPPPWGLGIALASGTALVTASLTFGAAWLYFFSSAPELRDTPSSGAIQTSSSLVAVAVAIVGAVSVVAIVPTLTLTREEE